MFLDFVLGFICAILCLAAFVWYFVLDVRSQAAPPFIDQFPPIVVPEELRKFLRTGEDGGGVSKWESSLALTLLFHLLFQEHKDSRSLRRWVHKRLQLELNDLTTRSQVGRIAHDIRIRDLCLGNKFPIINRIRVEKVEMSDDRDTFETVVFLIDMEYSGGFEASIDVKTAFGVCNLSLKVFKLAGNVRLILSRKPYSHWAFSFTSMPIFEFDVNSQIIGHHFKPVIALIRDQLRRILQRKHVWPFYKIRYRPVFPNPHLQPSPPLGAFAHVELVGGIEVTVLQCSRLKMSLVSPNTPHDVFCTISLDQKPFLQSNSVSHSVTVMLTFKRFKPEDDNGITYFRYGRSTGNPVRVQSVEPGSLADHAHIKAGDVIIAINSLFIRSEQQVEKLFKNSSELSVLVERDLEDIDDQELQDGEVLVGDAGGSPDDAFACVGLEPKRPTDLKLDLSPKDEDVKMREHSTSVSDDVSRRHSLSALPDSTATSTPQHTSPSAASSIDDLKTLPKASLPGVNRTESARVPHVLVSTPSVEMRRAMSESQLPTIPPDEMFDEIIKTQHVAPQGRAPPSSLSDHPARLDGLSDDNDDKNATLRANDQHAMLPSTSQTSLMSGVSANTNADEDADASKLDRHRPQSTRKARLHNALAAGKKRMLELIPPKKRVSPSLDASIDNVEVGVEAGDFDDGSNSRSQSPAPFASGGELPSKDPDSPEHKKRPRTATARKKKAAPCSWVESASSNARSTRAVHLQPDVLWGQSLHFEFDAGERALPQKYLNVAVLARAAAGEPEPDKPVLLGYTSIFVPQLLDDCKLTLSNCHREIFHLKPPQGAGHASEPAGASEFARHPGHDPRLLFGDVTLNFRYFPAGLPQAARDSLNDSSDEERGRQGGVSSEPARPVTPAGYSSSQHEWLAWSAKQGSSTCALCRGKIWLKVGLTCRRCQVVCHTKCQTRANAGIVCTPSPLAKNDEHLDDPSVDPPPKPSAGTPEAAAPELESASLIPESSAATSRAEGTELVSRKNRIKNRIVEKIAPLSWRRRRERHDDDAAAHSSSSSSAAAQNSGSPVSSIASCIPDVLPMLQGSAFLTSLRFQPGNAYNEDVIAMAKRLGRDIFVDLPPKEREAKVNEQIDRIQRIIQTTKSGREEAQRREASESSETSSTSSSFIALDERLQALAVVMLHYCSALQDVADRNDNYSVEEAEEEDERSENSAEAVIPPQTSTSEPQTTDASFVDA